MITTKNTYPCRGCNKGNRDLRFGWCFECVTKAEARAERKAKKVKTRVTKYNKLKALAQKAGMLPKKKTKTKTKKP